MDAKKLGRLLVWHMGFLSPFVFSGSFSDSSGVPRVEKCASFLDAEEESIVRELLDSLGGGAAVTPAGVIERIYALNHSLSGEAIEAAALDLIRLEEQKVVDASEFAEALARKVHLLDLENSGEAKASEGFVLVMEWFSKRLPLEAFEVLGKKYLTALRDNRSRQSHKSLSYAGYLESVLYRMMTVRNRDFLLSNTQTKGARSLYLHLKELWGVKAQDSSRHYWRAHSSVGQYFGFFYLRGEKIRKEFNKQIFILDPLELSPKDFGPSVVGVVQFMRLRPSVGVDLKSSEATPLGMFADFLSQISHAAAIGLTPKEKDKILDALIGESAGPIEGFDPLGNFAIRNQYFLDLAFFWEEFLAEIVSEQGNPFVPEPSSFLPFIRRIDPSVRQFLLFVTSEASVYKLIEESLNP